MEHSIQLSVIICTWNRAARLADALTSVEKSEIAAKIGWEVLIVDNNSTDNTRAVCDGFVARVPTRFRYLFEPRQGKSYALNAALDHARGEILAFTDDDVIVGKAWLAEIISAYDRYPCIGVAGKIVDTWQSEKPKWLSFEKPYKLLPAIVRLDLGDEPREMTAPPFGANMSVKRAAFRRYGTFRTDLGLTKDERIGAEDTEFGWRLLRGGEKLIYSPKAVVFHPVDESRISKRYFLDWYYALGKSLARTDRAVEGAVRYFGVPRYMLRSCLPYLVQWMISISEQRRFFYKLGFFLDLGRMVEERRLWLNALAGQKPNARAQLR